MHKEGQPCVSNNARPFKRSAMYALCMRTKCTQQINRPACHILFSFFSLRQCCFSFHSHLVCFVHKLIYELLAHSYSCFIFFVWGTFANGVHIFCLAKPFRLILAHKQIRCGFNRLFYFLQTFWLNAPRMRSCSSFTYFFWFYFFWDYRFSFSLTFSLLFSTLQM